jgi:putative peptide zinc metalloprotease protein
MSDVQQKIQGFTFITNDGRYLVKYNEDYFYISELFYNILHEIKHGTHKVDEFIKTYQISHSDYSELSDLIADKVDDIIGDDKVKKKYIRFSVKLLSEKTTTHLSTYLTVFFSKTLFRILFPLVILTAFATLFLINTSYSEHTIFDVSVLDTTLVYAVILIIMFFHELGHSAASKSFGINPKEIGFGFYIIFPVLYSNVTRVWELDKKKRVIVNLAGIYFQGLVNVAAFAYLLLNPYDNYFTFLVLLITKTNLFVMAYSMFPFVRNDGYWIISDYFNILNLNKRSYSYIIKMFQRREPLNYSLLAYSIGQYAFIFYLCYKYVPTIPNNVNAFYTHVTEHGWLDLFVSNWGLLLKLIFSLLIGIAAISSLFRFFKPVFKPEKEAIA